MRPLAPRTAAVGLLLAFHFQGCGDTPELPRPRYRLKREARQKAGNTVLVRERGITPVRSGRVLKCNYTVLQINEVQPKRRFPPASAGNEASLAISSTTSEA